MLALLAACAAPPAPPPPTIPPAPTLAGVAPTAVARVEPVQIGELATYTHPSGAFVVQAPAGWTLRDQSRPDELVLAWLDETRNGGVFVSVFEDPNPYTVDQLSAVLSGFLTRSYGELPAFRADPPRPRPDGAVRMAWAYTAATAQGDVPLAGASVISQNGNKVAILSVLLPDAQAAGLADATEAILAGYSLNPAAPFTPVLSPED